MAELRDLTKAVVAFYVFIILIIITLSLHYALTEKSFHLQNVITGGQIAIEGGGDNNNVVIGGEGNNPPGGQGNGGSGTTFLPPVIVTAEEKNNLCWMRRGLSDDDIRVVGNLLLLDACSYVKERKDVEVTSHESCFTITSEGKVSFDLCPQQDIPSLFITIPFGTGSAGLPPPSRNYFLPILIIFFVVSAIVLWSKFELSRNYHPRKPGEEPRIQQPEIGGGFGVPASLAETIETKMIMLPPLFQKEALPSASMLLDQKKLEQKKIHWLNKRIKKFNKLTRLMNQCVEQERFDQARKIYLSLFPLYSKIEKRVDDQKKKKLDRVMSYLYHELSIRENKTTIAHLMQDFNAQDVRKNVIPERKNEIETEANKDFIRGYDDIRILLQEKRFDQAKKMLYKKLGKEPERKQVMPSMLLRRDVYDSLDEIEKIHAKVNRNRFGLSSPDIMKAHQEFDTLRKDLQKQGTSEKNQKKFTTEK